MQKIRWYDRIRCLVLIRNFTKLGLLIPMFAYAGAFPGFTDSQAMPNFEKTIQSLSQKTKLPVVFPQKIPILPKRDSYYIYVQTQDFGSRYAISFDTTPDCHAKHSCSIGSLTVSTAGNPQIYYSLDNKVLTVPVELTGGRKAYFTPSHAAADFWPSQLEWREGNVFYCLGWNLVANAPEKEVLIAMANSIKK